MTTLASTMTEAELQSAVIDVMHTFGWAVAHFRAGRTASGSWRTPVEADGAGFFDLIAIRKGRLLLVEVKSARGRLSPQQVWWHQLAKAVEKVAPDVVKTFVWRPEDWTSGAIEEELR